MSEKTLIAWTDHTFNPWMGCTKYGDDCLNCYAETLTKNRMGLDVWGPGKPRQETKAPWQNVKKWNRLAAKDPGVLGPGMPHLVFTGSLMDWAEDHPEAARIRPRLFDTFRECQNLHFQLLTKRAEHIAEFLPDDWGDGYPNVWLGTSIGSMRYAKRADHLRKIPARVRFISYEPALGPLDDLDLSGFHWVIYGGESGPGFRAEDKDWARSMYRKCQAESVAFFHKQSAAYRTEMGIELDGKIVREYPVHRLVA